jgi:hypothetical protein
MRGDGVALPSNPDRQLGGCSTPTEVETEEMSDSNRPEAKRIQFEFPPDAVERLDRIKRETNAGSYAELVRNALRIYEWVLEAQNKGYEVGLVKDNDLVKVVEFLY